MSPNHSLSTHRGFSLVELMVALTIFSVVVTMSIGTLTVMIRANAKAQAESLAMTNLSFAIDSITRSIRTGRDFYCVNELTGSQLPGAGTTQDCAKGYTVVFTPGFNPNTRLAYRLNNGSIEQREDVRVGAVTTPGQWVSITSATPPTKVTVDQFVLTVDGAEDTGVNDDVQPEVSLLVSGTVESGPGVTESFRVQSTIVQRVLDY